MRILSDYTDDEHPLTAAQLCEELRNYGIFAERKAIYSDIDSLIRYGMDINKSCGAKKGFYLASRDFEFPEIRLLIDAVVSAPFITEKKTAELTHKLKSLLSRHQAEQISRQISRQKRVKFSNEEIYYNIDTIHRAIDEQKDVSFCYQSRQIADGRVTFSSGNRVTVSPYALVWSNDKYYMVGNSRKYDAINNYRIDRMKGIEIVCETPKPSKTAITSEIPFDVPEYLKKSIDIFYGKQDVLELICKKDFLEAIIDKFGTGITLYNHSDDKILAIIDIYVCDALVEWVLQYSDKIYVKSPASLKNLVVQKIKSFQKQYEKDLCC